MDKQKNKKKIITILIYVFILILSNNITYASGTNSLITEQENLGIDDFIEGTEEYSGEFFDDIDISELLGDAIVGNTNNTDILNRILELIGPVFLSTLKTMGSILVIVLIHSILKAISDGLQNDGIAKMIYYVQYILIVTIIMASFSEVIKMVEDTVTNLVGFLNLLAPLLITLMMYTGNIVTTSMLEPVIIFMGNFIGNTIQVIIIPLTLVFTALIIISKLSDKVQIESLAKFLKSGIVWFLCIILTIFVSVVSLEGNLGSSIDGITAKTSKSIVSSSIPVVGKILGDVVDTVLGSGIILKNAVGFVGIIIVVGIAIIPVIKLGILSFSYSLLGTILEPIADSKITKLLSQIGDVFKILLASLSSLAFLLIIGTALVLKISDTGMMYR